MRCSRASWHLWSFSDKDFSLVSITGIAGEDDDDDDDVD